MGTIRTIALRDIAVFPDKKVLSDVLGAAFEAYEALMLLFEQHGMMAEWRYYNDGKAWLCKVQLKKRTIVWMSAWQNSLQATIYVSSKFLDGLNSLPLSDRGKQVIQGSPFVGKSKACTFIFGSLEKLTDFETLVEYKLRCK